MKKWIGLMQVMAFIVMHCSLFASNGMLSIPQWETALSFNIPYSQGENSEYETGGGKYGFDGRVGYNFTDWFQVGLETGYSKTTLENTVTKNENTSAYSFSSISHAKADVKTIHLAPKARLQFYLGEYAQPFVDFGMGYYSQNIESKAEFNSSYVSKFTRETTTGNSIYSDTSSGFGINTGFGINIGPKEGRFKARLAGEFHKVFSDDFTIDSMISPSLGFIYTF